MGNLPAVSPHFLESLKEAVTTRSASKNHILTIETTGKVSRIVTAPSTFYNRAVSFLFGSNRSIATAIKEDLTKKYGLTIASRAFNRKDHDYVQQYGLNVLEGMQIYETAKALSEKDKEPPNDSITQTKNDQVVTKPVLPKDRSTNEQKKYIAAPRVSPTISNIPQPIARTAQTKALQNRKHDTTNEAAEYALASLKQSNLSEKVATMSEELGNPSEMELETSIATESTNLTEEEKRTVLDYLKKKVSNQLKENRVRYQAVMGVPSTITAQASDLYEELPSLSPKLEKIVKAKELKMNREVLAELELKEQEALTRYMEAIKQRSLVENRNIE